MKRLAASLFVAAIGLGGCTPDERAEHGPAQRIVSLDYCADQFVLRFAPRDAIVALSPDAAKHFSYMRGAAAGIPVVRPRTADVLMLQPDLVIRSYGGGADAPAFLERVGVRVVQLGYPQTIGDVRDDVRRIGRELGNAAEAEAVVADMDRRLAAIAADPQRRASALYMTPGGVTAGESTLVDDLLVKAGLTNFQDRPGWNPIPLERLAYERPDIAVAAFFESPANAGHYWSAARHPIARKQLAELPVAELEGAWTSCGGWFLVDAIETLAAAKGHAR